MTNDPFAHFVEAQNPVFSRALAELRAGRKRSHWMWFVFPQIAGLGRSAMAQRYALSSLDEVKRYLAHPVLGPRLAETTSAVLSHVDENGRPLKSIHAIFGSPDDLKFHSSMTLFHRAAPDDPLYAKALTVFFGGDEDGETLKRI